MAKDPEQHGLRQFSVWDPTVWDPTVWYPTVPQATDFGSETPLTDWDPTVWDPTVPRPTDFGLETPLTRAKTNCRGPYNTSVV